MSLSTEVQARYPTQRLVNLTNAGAGDTGSVNTTRLDAACTDVAALFKIHAGIAFDATDARHVAVACEGVIGQLEVRLGSSGSRKRIKEWIDEELKPLSLVTGRNKVTPTTDSQLTPTSDLDPGQTLRRPDFDRRRFEKFTPDGPAIGDDVL